jgi:O-antigen ligase
MLLPWAGLLWTNDVNMGLDFATKSYYWLFAFAIASLSFQSPETFIKAFLSGLTFTAALSLIQFTGLIPMWKGYPGGFMSHINHSLFIVFGLLLLAFYFRKVHNKKVKIFIILLMLLYFLNLIVGYGRAGYLAFLISSPLIIYKIVGRRHIIKAAWVIILFIGISILSPTVKMRIDQAVTDIKQYDTGNPNTSIGLRFYMWEGAIKIFLKNPVLGVGTGGYQKAINDYEALGLQPLHINFSQPHNSFLYMASSFGIIGIISLLWLFTVFLKKGWRARNDIVGFSVLSFGMVLIIGSFTDTQILSFATAKMFALLMGIKTGQNEK